MMTSINPKNVNLNNMRQNEPDIAPNQINNLFQRNNYLTDKRNLRSNEGNNNNLDFNQEEKGKISKNNINEFLDKNSTLSKNLKLMILLIYYLKVAQII